MKTTGQTKPERGLTSRQLGTGAPLLDGRFLAALVVLVANDQVLKAMATGGPASSATWPV